MKRHRQCAQCSETLLVARAQLSLLFPRIRPETASNGILLADHCLVDGHARNGFAVCFLLWRVDTVGVRVHCQTVHLLLHWEVLQPAVMIRVVHLEYGDSSARTRN